MLYCSLSAFVIINVVGHSYIIVRCTFIANLVNYITITGELQVLFIDLIKKNIEGCSIICYLLSWLMIWWKNKHCFFFLLWDLLPVIITPTCRFWADFLSLNGHQEFHPIDWEEEKESFREERNSFQMRAEEPEAEILQLLRTLETILQPNLQEEFLWDSLMYISKWLNGHFVWL